jgi:lipopolysaccharide/colanic/teichoic acid biosynthesis glycosyltransferase
VENNTLEITNTGSISVASSSPVEAVDRLINLSLSLLMSVPALPIIAVCYIFYRWKSPRPRASFFYSGERLGRNFKPYTMYKIRTLREDGEYEKQGVILPPDSERELPCGKFLRYSRLDELPQLWNVIRGDMNLVGPRPLRRVVYEQLRQELSNCDTRFKVKPGLTGYAQFLTPSHTPKRIRFAIDNYWTEKGRRPLQDLFLIAWTIREVLRKSICGCARTITTRIKTLIYRGKAIQERKMERQRSKYIWIQMAEPGFDSIEKAQPMIHIYDINSRALSFYSEQELPENDSLYFYLVGCKECETGPNKRARCIGTVYKKYPEEPESGTGPRYVVFYEPVSPRHRYLVDHYVLHQTVA